MQNPKNTEFTQNPSTEMERGRVAESIATYLRSESEFLDQMITSSRQLQRLIENRDMRTDLSSVDAQRPADHQQHWLQQVDSLRQRIDQQVQPIQQNRVELGRLLKELSAAATPSISLVEFARQLKLRKNPRGAELLNLRRKIKAQLRELDLINLGNQVVLAYALDHRQRLLAGIMGNPSTQAMHNQSYNAQGNLTKTKSGNLLERQC